MSSINPNLSPVSNNPPATGWQSTPSATHLPQTLSPPSRQRVSPPSAEGPLAFMAIGTSVIMAGQLTGSMLLGAFLGPVSLVGVGLAAGAVIEKYLQEPTPGPRESQAALPAEQFQAALKNKSLPDEFQCPITREIINDPVGICDDSVLRPYERSALEAMLAAKSDGIASNPMTRKPFSKEDLVALPKLKEQIQEYIKVHPQEEDSI